MRTPRLRYRLGLVWRFLASLLAIFLIGVPILVASLDARLVLGQPVAVVALLLSAAAGVLLALAAYSGVDVVTDAPPIPAGFVSEDDERPPIPPSRVLPDSDPELTRLVEVAPVEQAATLAALRSYLQHLVREINAIDDGLRSGRLVLWRASPNARKRLEAHVAHHAAARKNALAYLEERAKQLPPPATE